MSNHSIPWLIISPEKLQQGTKKAKVITFRNQEWPSNSTWKCPWNCIYTNSNTQRYNHIDNSMNTYIYVKGFLHIFEVQLLLPQTSRQTLFQIFFLFLNWFLVYHRIPQSFFYFYQISFHKVLTVSVAAQQLTSWAFSVQIVLTEI